MRIFIAVDICNPEVLGNLSRARDLLVESKADLKPVATENIHITIRFIGETPSNIVNEICRELSNIEIKPFKVRVKGLGAFPNMNRPRVIWAGVVEGVEELAKIHEDVEKMLKRFKIPMDREEFVPHITLARVKSDRNISRLISIVNNMIDMDFGEFVVNRIVLKKSVLTPSGPIYSDICVSKAGK